MKNRELKFRIWSGIKRDWLNSCVIGDNGIPLLLYVEVTDDKNIHNRVYTIENLNPVIQQYTGLLDKKDKEIYEGDIVQFNDDFISEIIWCEEDAAFQVKRIDKPGGAFLNQNYILNFQIVGNIFENPELLKNEN